MDIIVIGVPRVTFNTTPLTRRMKVKATDQARVYRPHSTYTDVRVYRM